MKLKTIEMEEVFFPLKRPFVTALRRVEKVRALHIRLITDSGLTGMGAAAPLEAITGETMESLKAAINHMGGRLLGAEVADLNSLLESIQPEKSGLKGNTSARAALDMALYDLFAKKAGIPLYEKLGGRSPSIISDLTISLGEKEQMCQDAAAAAAEGYKVLKIKLGRQWKEDFARIEGIHERVDCSLRIDANQGWNLRETLLFMDMCDQKNIDIDFLEQPVPAGDLGTMAEIRKNIHCPLVADESVFSPADALNVIRAEAADIINIKLLKSGGIYNALKISAVSQAAGLRCMIGCMMESPIGISSALHFAASQPAIEYYDLDLPYLITDIPAESGLAAHGLVLGLQKTAPMGPSGQSTAE